MRTSAGFSLSFLAALIGFAGYWYLAPRSESFGMFLGFDEVATVRLALSFAATLAGVVLGSLYRQLRQLQVEGQQVISDAPAFITRMFRSVDLWLGLAGSPIVYALLLQSTNGMNLPGLLLIALENGFCCLIILNQFVGKAEADAKEKH